MEQRERSLVDQVSKNLVTTSAYKPPQPSLSHSNHIVASSFVNQNSKPVTPVSAQTQSDAAKKHLPSQSAYQGQAVYRHPAPHFANPDYQNIPASSYSSQATQNATNVSNVSAASHGKDQSGRFVNDQTFGDYSDDAYSQSHQSMGTYSTTRGGHEFQPRNATTTFRRPVRAPNASMNNQLDAVGNYSEPNLVADDAYSTFGQSASLDSRVQNQPATFRARGAVPPMGVNPRAMGTPVGTQQPPVVPRGTSGSSANPFLRGARARGSQSTQIRAPYLDQNFSDDISTFADDFSFADDLSFSDFNNPKVKHNFAPTSTAAVQKAPILETIQTDSVSKVPKNQAATQSPTQSDLKSNSTAFGAAFDQPSTGFKVVRTAVSPGSRMAPNVAGRAFSRGRGRLDHGQSTVTPKPADKTPATQQSAKDSSKVDDHQAEKRASSTDVESSAADLDLDVIKAALKSLVPADDEDDDDLEKQV